MRVVDDSTGEVADTGLKTEWAQFCNSSDYLVYRPAGVANAIHLWNLTQKEEDKDATPLEMDTPTEHFCYPEFTRSADSSLILFCETDVHSGIFGHLYLVSPNDEE